MTTAQDNTVKLPLDSDQPPGIRPTPPPEGWTKAITVNKKWTSFEVAWMEINLPIYRNKKGEDRRNLVKWVQRQVHLYWGTTYNENAMKDPATKKRWERRKASMYDYFRNHSRGATDIKIPYHNEKVSFGTVLRMEKAEEIMQLATELSGGLQRGDKEWIGYYKRAEKQIRETLTTAERAAIEQLMKEYESKGFPADEQAKNAERMGEKALNWMHKFLFNKMGMRCVTLATWYNPDGAVQFNIYDRNSKHVRPGHPAVNTMRQMLPEGYGKVHEAFRAYCRKLVAIEKPNVSQGDAAVAADPVAEIKRMPNGHTIVPEKIKGETGKQQTRWIREVMKSEYGLAKQRDSAPVPWKELENDNSAFIENCYIPVGVTLGDPEKLGKEKATAILAHWRARQQRGEIPLLFSHVKVNEMLVEAYYDEGLLPPLPQNTQSKGNSDNERIILPPATNNHSSDAVDSSDANDNTQQNAPRPAAVQNVRNIRKRKSLNEGRAKLLKGKGRRIIESPSVDSDGEEESEERGPMERHSDSAQGVEESSAQVSVATSGIFPTEGSGVMTLQGAPPGYQPRNEMELVQIPPTPTTMSPVPEDLRTPNNIPAKFTRKARLETPDMPRQQETPLQSQENTPIPAEKSANPRLHTMDDYAADLVGQSNAPAHRTATGNSQGSKQASRGTTAEEESKPHSSVKPPQTTPLSQQNIPPPAVKAVKPRPKPKQRFPGDPAASPSDVLPARRRPIPAKKVEQMDEKQAKSSGLYTLKKKGAVKVKPDPSTRKGKGREKS